MRTLARIPGTNLRWCKWLCASIISGSVIYTVTSYYYARRNMRYLRQALATSQRPIWRGGVQWYGWLWELQPFMLDIVCVHKEDFCAIHRRKKGEADFRRGSILFMSESRVKCPRKRMGNKKWRVERWIPSRPSAPSVKSNENVAFSLNLEEYIYRSAHTHSGLSTLARRWVAWS